MRTFWIDLRYGLRMLAAKPGFTAVAILSLALGIGATTSMFSLADTLLLRPLPVARPSEVVRVISTSPAVPYGQISYPDYSDFQAGAPALSLTAYHTTPVAWNADPNSPAQLRVGMSVDPGFFDVLGVRPELGRAFRLDENREQVVILSHWFWETQFGSDPAVIGRHVRMSKLDFTIVGVAPKSFPGIERYVHEAVYVPLGIMPRLYTGEKNPLEQRDLRNLTVYARLHAGYTREQAQSQLQALAASLERAHPDTNRSQGIVVLPELDARIRQEPGDAVQVALLLAVSSLVLLIACANVASLLLARARARSREIAIRLAIGAGRGRLFRQLLTESLLLGAIGGAAGLLLAVQSISYLSSIRLPTDFPLWLVAQLDSRVLICCAAASLLSSVFFGVAPAWHSLKTDLSTTLKSGDAGLAGKHRRFQVRNLLVIGQVAFSVTLLVISGLLWKDFGNLLRFRPGFRTDHILVMLLDPSLVRYTEPQSRTFYRQLVDRVQTLPGVRAVSLGQHVPLGFTSTRSKVLVEGYEAAKGQENLSILSNAVDENYFRLMQIPLVSGRAFERSDTASSPPVAIVNETMAGTYWPKRSALGGRIRIGQRTLEVVGIAKDIRYRDVSESAQPFVYLPFSQNSGDAAMTLHIETAGDPASLAAPVLAEIRRLDPGQPVQEVHTLQQFFEEGALFGSRLVMQFVTGIGLFGLVLAIAGLYGVIAYSVSRRTREIGIRIAIGADPASVAGLVLRQGVRLTAIGAAIGLALALAASKLTQTLLVGVSARDPWVYAAVPLALAAISLLACYLPARRAARVDPLQALRQD